MVSLDFEKTLSEHLTLIDEALSAIDFSLKMRPLRAAMTFVDEAILEIKGESKENYLEKEWFAQIYRLTEEWYTDRYGDLLSYEQSKILAIVQVFGVPCSVLIPLTTSVPAENGRVWLCFPKEVLPDEDPLEWLEIKPNLSKMSVEKLHLLQDEIVAVATRVRMIRNDVSTAIFERDTDKMLVAGTLSALEKSAKDIMDGSPEQLSTCMWELHLLIEKVLKAYLRQNELEAPNIHDLFKLRKLSKLDTSDLDGAFSLCPSKGMAIGYRYAENPPPSISETIEFYLSAMDIVSFYCAQFHREIVMNNAKFLIQAPPWKSKV